MVHGYSILNKKLPSFISHIIIYNTECRTVNMSWKTYFGIFEKQNDLQKVVINRPLKYLFEVNPIVSQMKCLSSENVNSMLE